MRKYLIMLYALTTVLCTQAKNDGSQLWLATNTTAGCHVSCLTENNATINLAKEELSKNYQGKTITLNLDPTLQLGEGYRLTATTITASSTIGILYGAYELIRLQRTDALSSLPKTELPAVGLRILNHWDNLDGSVERGYAGKSIWKWEEIKVGKKGKGGSISKDLHQRIVAYARANASIGINGTVLNNVNASPKMMTDEYINKVKVISNILRPYGIRVYLSINFASSMHFTSPVASNFS